MTGTDTDIMVLVTARGRKRIPISRSVRRGADARGGSRELPDMLG